jgi:hypothetical protein
MKKYHEEHIAVERPHLNIPDATQRIYKFPNNYGASIVWGGSLQTAIRGNADSPYELAVIRFVDEEDYYLDYTTPLGNDVFRHLNEEQIRDLLKQIKNLEGEY